MRMLFQTSFLFLACGLSHALTVMNPQHGREGGVASKPAFMVSPSPPSWNNDRGMIDITDVLAETEAALLLAQEVFEESSSNNKSPTKEEGEQLVLASGMGGAFLGLAVGRAAMMHFPDVEPTMIPLMAASAVMGAASLSVSSNSEGFPGMVARAVLGKPFQTLGLSLQKAIDDSIGSTVVDAQYELETVTDQLKALPSLTAKNLQDAGKQFASASAKRLDEVVQDTLAAPGHLLGAALLQMKEGFLKSTLKIAERIQATPGRLVEASKEAALQSTRQAADRIQATPAWLVEAGKEAALQSTLAVADRIKAAPGRLVGAGKEVALQSTLQIAETIKAAPGKLVEASMEAAMQSTLHFADHIKASPQRSVKSAIKVQSSFKYTPPNFLQRGQTIAQRSVETAQASFLLRGQKKAKKSVALQASVESVQPSVPQWGQTKNAHWSVKSTQPKNFLPWGQKKAHPPTSPPPLHLL